MAAITVRAATVEDVAAVLAINAGGVPGVTPLTSAEAEAAIGGNARCWVAVDGARVIGYLIAYPAAAAYGGEEFAWFQAHYPSFLYVDQIAIAPASRGSGAGTRLYSAAQAAARARGIDTLTCEVNLEPPNPNSLAFHHRLGFRDVGVLRTADGRTVALLVLRLADHV